MNDLGPEMLRTFLAEHDVPCPACGYNLRHLQGTRCPECGDELVLRVGLADPSQRAGITGLIGLAAGAGLNGLLLGFLLIRIVIEGRIPHGLGPFVPINVGGLMVVGATTIFWVRSMRKIRRLRPSARWLLAGGCWALTLVDLLVFSLSVR